MEGLQILKPTARKGILRDGILEKGTLKNGLPEKEKHTFDKHSGVNVEVDIVACEEDDDVDDAMAKWALENLKFSVDQPVKRF